MIQFLFLDSKAYFCEATQLSPKATEDGFGCLSSIRDLSHFLVLDMVNCMNVLYFVPKRELVSSID